MKAGANERTLPRRSLLASPAFPLAFALTATILVASTRLFERPLSPRYLSGWLMFLACVALAGPWWRLRSRERMDARLESQLLLSLPLLACFAVHVDFRVPRGELDLLLTTGFLGTVASLVVGRFLASRNTPKVWAWLRFHIAWSYSLLALGLVHAALVHAHGFFADFVR